MNDLNELMTSGHRALHDLAHEEYIARLLDPNPDSESYDDSFAAAEAERIDSALGALVWRKTQRFYGVRAS